MRCVLSEAIYADLWTGGVTVGFGSDVRDNWLFEEYQVLDEVVTAGGGEKPKLHRFFAQKKFIRI